jgi:hypothetical protein
MSQEEMITTSYSILSDKRFEKISKKKSSLLITKPKLLVASMLVYIHTYDCIIYNLKYNEISQYKRMFFV